MQLSKKPNWVMLVIIVIAMVIMVIVWFYFGQRIAAVK